VVLVDGVERGVLDRGSGVGEVELDLGDGPSRIDVLVENQGRVNFGPGLADRKGILGPLTLDGAPATGLTMYPLPLDDLSALDWASASRESGAPAPTSGAGGPVLCRGEFEIDHPADSHLALPGWTKGVAWINGVNLGRYWDIGPQRTLYLPGPLLRPGTNELVILELHHVDEPEIRLIAEPDLGD
jgi:beta-galactosidase